MRGRAERYKQSDDEQYDNQDDVPFHKLLVNSYDGIILRQLRKNKIHAGIKNESARSETALHKFSGCSTESSQSESFTHAIWQTNSDHHWSGCIPAPPVADR